MYKFDTLYLMNKGSESPGLVYNWQGKKILIVEDDYVNYLFFHEILSFSYACLIRAVSLQEAFDMLASGNRFDLVIINTAIPGNENCRSVKRMKLLWPHIRVVAISGCECANRCFPSGCDTMISRDIDSYDMRNMVNEMFYPLN
jgi:CheY-like chemotaxis protein